MRILLIILTLVALALGGWLLWEKPQVAEVPESELLIETATLKNGMEVVVVPSTRVPAVSHFVWVKAGAIDEALGASGVAHYLEHLLFKGTPTTPAGEYSETIVSLGGNHNAFTGQDFTGYYVNIAKEHLEKVMLLEADRMANTNPSDIDYEKERDVILEERKSRTDSNPSALFSEQLMAQLFVHHPYGTPIIGWRHEMEGLGKTEAMDFYRKYYTPGNMVLVVAGDTSLAEVLPLAEKYYGALSGEASPRSIVQEPPQRGAKRFTMQHSQVRQPQWVRHVQVPSLAHGNVEEAFALMLLAEWLGGDKSSYLYREMVVKQELATSVTVSYSGMRIGPGLLSISALPKQGVSMQQVEDALSGALEKLAQTDLTEENLMPYKTQLIASSADWITGTNE